MVLLLMMIHGFIPIEEAHNSTCFLLEIVLCLKFSAFLDLLGIVVEHFMRLGELQPSQTLSAP